MLFEKCIMIKPGVVFCVYHVKLNIKHLSVKVFFFFLVSIFLQLSIKGGNPGSDPSFAHY